MQTHIINAKKCSTSQNCIQFCSSCHFCLIYILLSKTNNYILIYTYIHCINIIKNTHTHTHQTSHIKSKKKNINKLSPTYALLCFFLSIICLILQNAIRHFNHFIIIIIFIFINHTKLILSGPF